MARAGLHTSEQSMCCSYFSGSLEATIILSKVGVVLAALDRGGSSSGRRLVHALFGTEQSQ